MAFILMGKNIMGENTENRNPLYTRDSIRSLTLLLGILSENIDITNIRIPKACNSAMYALSSKDGNLDTSVSFTHDHRPATSATIAKDKRALIDVLNYIYIDEMGLGESPLPRESRSAVLDVEIYKRVSKIVNRYIADIINGTGDDVLDQIQKVNYQLDTFFDNADKPSRELHALYGASFLIDKINYAITHDYSSEDFTADDVKEQIESGCTYGSTSYFEGMRPSFDSYPADTSRDIDIEIEKEKARLTTLAIMSPFCKASLIRLPEYSNQTALRFYDEKNHPTDLHLDRNARANEKEKRERLKELRTFKDALYRNIYDNICAEQGHTPHYYPPQHVMEASIYPTLEPRRGMKISPSKVKAMFDDTINMVADANFGHDETLLMSTLLQCMALAGYGIGHLPDLLHANKSPKLINEKLDWIYDHVAANRSRLHHVLDAIVRELKADVTKENANRGRASYRPNGAKKSLDDNKFIRLRPEDVYFEKGLTTRFYDVMLSLPAISCVLDNIHEWINSHSEADSETTMQYIQYVFMSLVRSMSQAQFTIGLIDETSSKLSKPRPGEAKTIGTLMNQIKGIEDPEDDPDGY